MYALDELERVAGVFVKVCYDVLERGFVDAYARGDSGRVDKYVTLFDYLVQIHHIPALVVDVKAPVFV